MRWTHLALALSAAALLATPVLPEAQELTGEQVLQRVSWVVSQAIDFSASA